MRVQTADYQTVELCYPLSAIRFPWGREMVRPDSSDLSSGLRPAPSCGRSQTLRVFAMVSYVVGCVEAGDFGAPLSTLEMTGGGAFRMKMTKRSVNGKILFPKLWKMKSFGNRIFT